MGRRLKLASPMNRAEIGSAATMPDSIEAMRTPSRTCFSTTSSSRIFSTTDLSIPSTRRFAISSSIRLRFASRTRPNESPRYEMQTCASVDSASWMAASSAESPPPTTRTLQPWYCSGSIRL